MRYNYNHNHDYDHNYDRDHNHNNSNNNNSDNQELVLRGCIGTFDSNCKLHSGLKQYAIHSAIYDTRFPPVEEHEIPHLQCIVSLLTDFEYVDNLHDWAIGMYHYSYCYCVYMYILLLLLLLLNLKKESKTINITITIIHNP